MDRYLDRYIGKYRVKAHYDLETNDWIRDKRGNIDNDFADFYIDCYNGIQIKHVCPAPRKRNHELACYVPNPNKGANILKEILKDKKISFENNISKTKLAELAIEKTEIFTEIEFTDGELYFSFTPEKLEYISKFIKIKTNGCNITPLSTRNLPKRKSIIPNEDIENYKNILSSYCGNRTQKAMFIKNINKDFEKNLPKKWKNESKKLKMDFKDYIYYKKLWNKYLNEIEKNIK